MTLAKRADKWMNRFLSGNTMHYKQIFAIIVPILVDQAFVVCLNLLNTAMVSSSGEAAVSAVSMVDSLNFFLMQAFIAVSTGGTVVVAQYKGRGDKKLVRRSAAQAISAVAVSAVVIAVIMAVFHGPLLNLLFGKAEPAVMANARIYIIASGLSYPCFAVYEACCGVMRGIAKTKSSLALSMIYNISYVLCNVFFITVCKMGVLGLAISLNTSRALAMVCSFVYICIIDHDLRLRIKEILHIDWRMIKRILFIGLPFAAEQMFFNGGKLLTQTFIVQLGTASMAVNAICSSMAPLFQIGANALSLSIVTVVGQSIGRGDIKEAKKFIYAFLAMGTVSFLVMVAIMLPLFPWIVSLFHPSPEIVPTIHKIMVMTAVTQPFLWPVSFIAPSSLRAAGDSAFTSAASMLSMWLFRVVWGYVLGIVLGFGITGVWAAMMCEWAVRGIIFMSRLHTKRWYAHQVI